jgi:hypothetical protein
MDEQGLDSSMPVRPLRHEDAMQAEAEAAPLHKAWSGLWGRTPADLRRQQNTWFSPPALCSLHILADAKSITVLEARREIVRRAIDYIERH